MNGGEMFAVSLLPFFLADGLVVWWSVVGLLV